MQRTFKIVGIITVIIVALLSVLYINIAVYPFQAAQPNFTDVEKYYNQLEIPADWELIETSENSGIKGRRCPVTPGPRCFYKSATYKVENFTDVDAENLTKDCSGKPIIDRPSENVPQQQTTNYSCLLETDLDIGMSYNKTDGTLYVSIGT